MEECQCLGDYLRERRLEKGLSLEDVSSRTKIQPHYLQALDKGLYDQLPAEIYLKGFLISYAEVLDVPSEKLLELYRSDCPDKKPIDLKPPEPIKTYGMASSGNGAGFRLGLILLLVVLIVGGFWWFAADDSSDIVETVREEKQPTEAQLEKTPAKPPAPVAEPVDIEPVEEPAQVPVEVEELLPVKEEAVAPQEVEAPVTEAEVDVEVKSQPAEGNDAKYSLPAAVELKALSTVAVELKIDGRPLRSYSLQKGSLLRWKVKKTIDLRIDPPQGADVFIGNVQISLDEEGRFSHSAND